MSEGQSEGVESRIAQLVERGVVVVDPRQTWVGPEVRSERICSGAVLHPGTRLHGAKTWLGEGAEVGTEGPATIRDAALDRGASVASGYVEGAVLLRDAKAGANAHLRPGTLLEEEASTAHAVGLKHTILLSFVTLGSLINFCDALVAGGTSRKDHSEIGSGFIHFNFTPWGARGDKATPSLVGNVVRGVFLREPRVFLGGAGGLVGPARVGFGSVAAAGQVIRRDIGEGRLELRPTPKISRDIDPGHLGASGPRKKKNVEYAAQLHALRAWYEHVRLPALAADSSRRPPLEAALELLDVALAERHKRLAAFLEERNQPVPDPVDPSAFPACPLEVAPRDTDHVKWVQGLAEGEVDQLRGWLEAIVEQATAGD